MARTGKHRRHRPDLLGPRLEARGRWFSADLRPFGGQRYTSLRNPKHPGWPNDGERTEDADIAARWAWSYVDVLRGEARDRQLGKPKARPLGAALDEYERHREHAVSESTRKSDHASFQYLRACFGERTPVHRITTAKLQEVFAELLAVGFATSTVNTRRHDISAFFGWLGGENPCSGVVLPTPERADDPYAWSNADVVRLRRHAGPLRTVLELGLATGARQGELLALRWSDFDFKSKTVRIVRQFRDNTTRIVPLKSKLARTALVLPFFWRFYREADGYCITGPLKSYQLYEPFQRLLTAAGVNGPQRGVHDMRRTYGRLFLEAGGWLDELQRSLGHASIRTTERAYGRFQAEVAAEFARKRIYGAGRMRLLR